MRSGTELSQFLRVFLPTLSKGSSAGFILPGKDTSELLVQERSLHLGVAIGNSTFL